MSGWNKDAPLTPPRYVDLDRLLSSAAVTPIFGIRPPWLRLSALFKAERRPSAFLMPYPSRSPVGANRGGIDQDLANLLQIRIGHHRLEPSTYACRGEQRGNR